MQRASVFLFATVSMLSLSSASEARAQQSLFNVPSTTATPEGDLFFQEQLNLWDTGVANTTFEYGLWKTLEIGINILHVNLYPVDSEIPEAGRAGNDDFLANASFLLKPASWLSLQLGTEFGITPRSPSLGIQIVSYSWVTARIEPDAHVGALVVGAYGGNRTYLGPGNAVGGMVGLDVPIVRGLLSGMADWVIGTNEASVAVIGAVLEIGAGWQLSAGAQIPSPLSNSGPGVVLELTRFPVDG